MTESRRIDSGIENGEGGNTLLMQARMGSLGGGRVTLALKIQGTEGFFNVKKLPPVKTGLRGAVGPIPVI